MPEPPSVATLHRTREHPDGAVLLSTDFDAIALSAEQAARLGLELYSAARELQVRAAQPTPKEDANGCPTRRSFGAE